MNRQYDAILKNWHSIVTGTSDQAYILFFGEIHEDKQGRWADGEKIRTSMSESFTAKDGDIVQTRNTRYLLQGEAE